VAGLIDTGAERERLSKRLQELTRSLRSLQGRLSNPGYVEKAPAHLVEESRAKVAETEGEIATIQRKLDELGP